MLDRKLKLHIISNLFDRKKMKEKNKQTKKKKTARAISILNRRTNPEQRHSIVLQETNGGGAGGRETGREPADAVPAGRGPR